MPDCEFCKIAQKNSPAHILFEDEKFIAFLDAHPLVKGHTLVIPKTHFETVWDMQLTNRPPRPSKEYLAQYFNFVTQVANYLRIQYKQPVNAMILEYEVKHACIHIIPNVNKGFGWLFGNFLKSKKRSNALTIDEGNQWLREINLRK